MEFFTINVFKISVVVPAFNKAGISGTGKNIVTKHDPNICGRKNVSKVMDTVS